MYCIFFFLEGSGVLFKKDSNVMNIKLDMEVNSFNEENLVTIFYEIGKYHKDHTPSQCGKLESVWVLGLARDSFAVTASECNTIYVC